tara:strand:+ start:252 stop:674 length:423 start_codon:yes stop_codon:yes gene_type:complete
MENILGLLGPHGEALWFFAGAITMQLLSKLIGYSQIVMLLQEVSLQILKLIGSTVEDVAFIKAKKFEMLRAAEVPEDKIEEYRSIDEKTFNNWKTSIIIKLISHYPPRYRKILTFYDWAGAMRVLEEVYEREAKHERKNK